jgi:hypothetical protein
MIALDLATKPKTGVGKQPAGGKHRFLCLGHSGRFAGNELNSACGTAGISTACMKLVDLRIVRQRIYQTLTGCDFKRAAPLNGDFWHEFSSRRVYPQAGARGSSGRRQLLAEHLCNEENQDSTPKTATE